MPKLPTQAVVPVIAPLRPLGHRIEALRGLLAMLAPPPSQWRLNRTLGPLNGKVHPLGGSSSDAPKTLALKTCESYKELVEAWKDPGAMKWFDGLDSALATMLASSMSTPFVGEQLWLKIIGPPSCLGGDTPIYDPVEGSTRSVKERWECGEKFFVYTKTQEGTLGVAQALPPERLGINQLYEIEMESGAKITVTAGHLIWNGTEYIETRQLSNQLLSSGEYRLPSISEHTLLTLKPNVLHLKRRAPDYLRSCFACSYLYGEQPLQGVCNDQCVLPLLGDALKRSQLSFCTDDVSTEYKHIHRFAGYNVRPSSYHAQDLYEQLRGYLSHEHEDTCEQSFDSFSLVPHTRRCFYRKCRGLRALQSESSSMESFLGQSHYLVGNGECEKYRIESTQSVLHTHSVKHQSCIAEQALRSVDHLNGFLAFSPDVSVLKVQVHNRVDLSALSIMDKVMSVKPLPADYYYDFSVPETKNYWACGIFNHNCGKTSLMEGLAVAREWYFSRDTIRGFHSGARSENADDLPLADLVKGKTLGTKDGDTLLKAPNLAQILSEGRALYDRVSRTNYRNFVNREYLGHRMTWHLAGTSSLREIDDSELGARFLDVVVMEKIDDKFENEVGQCAALQEASNMLQISDGKPESQYPPKLAEAMSLSAGYLDFLRTNALELTKSVRVDEKALLRCNKFGKFTAFMRARPSSEEAEREFSARLVKQYTRMAIAIACTLGKSSLDDEVLARVHKVSMDTSRGQTLDLVRFLAPRLQGIEMRALMAHMHLGDDKLRKQLTFLRRIGVVETDVNHKRWRVMPNVQRLYEELKNA